MAQSDREQTSALVETNESGYNRRLLPTAHRGTGESDWCKSGLTWSTQAPCNELAHLLALPIVVEGARSFDSFVSFSSELMSALQLDFACVLLWHETARKIIEVVRIAKGRDSLLWDTKLQELLALQVTNSSPAQCPFDTYALDDWFLPVFNFRVNGTESSVLFLAGARRTGFPQQLEYLALNVAARKICVDLQRVVTRSGIAEDVNFGRAIRPQHAEQLEAKNEALLREMSEQRRVEQSLRENAASLKKSEASLRQALDAIPAMVWCSLPDGSCEFVNRAYYEYTGLSQRWGWQAAIHPHDLGHPMEKWRESIKAGKSSEVEVRIRRCDGVYRWFLLRSSPFRDQSGTILRWYGAGADIHDLKSAQESARRSEAFLAEAQRLAKIGSFSWRVSSDEMTWSEQLYRIFGFEPGTPVTIDRIATRIHPDDLPLMKIRVKKKRSTCENFEEEVRLLMPNGSIKYLRYGAYAAEGNDRETEFFGIVQDITQRLVASEALTQARAELAAAARASSLGVLTASIAHEVNQPLSGIVTNASTCLRMLNSEPPNVAGAIETARRTIRDGNRAASVITRLRKLFNQKQINSNFLDLNEATREVIALLVSDHRRNRIVLRQELALDLPAIKGDRVQLQQVILNLLRNASDALAAVNDRPRDILVRSTHDSEYVHLSVEDSGVGIDAAAAGRLFEPFYTTKPDGMGIGLSVSRSIVDAHAGSLWARRNDQWGATFGFSIPYYVDCASFAGQPDTLPFALCDPIPNADRRAG